MMKKLSYDVKRASRRLGLWHPPGNKFTILNDDNLLIGYQKSGNTWLRFLIGHSKYGYPLDFYSIEDCIPDVYSSSDKYLLNVSRPRILSGHFRFNPRYVNGDRFETKVIYLVRDPRDVAISMYYWLRRTGSFRRGRFHSFILNYSLHDYLRIFPDDEYIPGGWGGHVSSWLEQSTRLGNRFLLVKYEDMKSSPISILSSVLNFLEIEVNEKILKFAIEFSSAKRMRQLEIRLSPILLLLLRKEPLPFVRKAYSGQWRELFDDEINSLYWKRYEKIMNFLGYPKY